MGLIRDIRHRAVQTTDSTPLPVVPYEVPPNSVATFAMHVKAFEAATEDAAFFTIVGGYKRGGGDSAVITGNPGNPQGPALAQLLTDLDGGSKDVGAANWGATLALDGIGLVVTVAGDDGKEIEWSTLLEIAVYVPFG